MAKLTNYEKHFRAKLNNKEFKVAYKKESHRLEVAYKVAQLRKANHFSQERLAQKVNTTQSVIARIEAGKQNLTTDKLQEIALACNSNLKIGFAR